MLKIILAILIIVEISIIPLMFLFLGTNILLPGVGLIVAGELIVLLLLFVEIFLISVTIILFRRIRRVSADLP